MDLDAPTKDWRPLWFWAAVAVAGLLLMAVLLSLLPSEANEVITIAANTVTFLGIVALVMGGLPVSASAAAGGAAAQCVGEVR